MNPVNFELAGSQKKFVTFLEKTGKAHATILAYGKDAAQLVQFLAEKKITQPTSVTVDMVEEFKKYLFDLGYIPKTVSRKLNSIKTFFRFLEETKTIKTNPTLAVTHPKYVNKPPRILAETEYRALRDAARQDPRAAAIIELLLQTGMRISELARLELEDVKDTHLIIRPFESHSQRMVSLNNAAKRALESYLNHRSQTKNNHIFITKTGKPLLVRNIRASVNRYFQIAKVSNAKVNDLRHTFITHQLENGASVVLLQKLVGHKRLSTTEKYLDLIKNKATPALKLEEL
ncbi:hypothetical protein COT66_00840 [Candidatus Shapirobacteria bacterium CG09_land_8_20_14_0_10_49_15]|uniref:Tyrosine recombinase XerC n=1 Tax=Candidatus Shapirobacteria bacterium CG09_land_8_20_14_0_10_49_15 TaxID=1974482 RepID=A0A2M6XB61_9BACT|nr:MAG: hypothetical protein COT66_00840 [Candidatus Shapirobacteria bacterium CG09_land_8_20_14_0_10_49_15]